MYTGPLKLYFCGHQTCLPGHYFGPFIREHYLIHCVKQGKGTYEAGGKKYSLKAGQGFLILPGEITYYKADEKEPWEYYWIGFDGYEVLHVLKECGLGAEQLVFSCEAALPSLRDLCLSHGEETLGGFKAAGFLYHFFSNLEIKKTESSLPAEQYLDQALFHIHNAENMDLKVEEIAGSIGIDRTYLYKLFMNKFKLSPQQYLINYRIQVASELLEKSDYSISQIALGCGFCDSSSFSRQFKKRKGVLPKEYRKRKEFSSG